MGKIIGIICLLLVFVILAVIVLKTDSEPNNSTSPTSTPQVTTSTPLDVDELKIEEIQVGTGSAVKSGDTITVHYLGTLLDGTKFDSSYDRGEPLVTPIGSGAVIQGWDEGMIGMKVGGKRKLTVPSSMGYGETGAGRIIPPGAGLIFEIELLDIESTQP